MAKSRNTNNRRCRMVWRKSGGLCAHCGRQCRGMLEEPKSTLNCYVI